MTVTEQDNMIDNIIEEFKGYEMIGGFVHNVDWYDLATDIVKLFTIHNVSKSVAKKYAEFCVECDRKGLPLLLLDDYIEQYCC